LGIHFDTEGKARGDLLGVDSGGFGCWEGFGVPPAFQSMLRGFWASLLSVPHGHHCLLLLPKSPIGLIDVQLVLQTKPGIRTGLTSD
jgi:hypothetical protein